VKAVGRRPAKTNTRLSNAEPLPRKLEEEERSFDSFYNPYEVGLHSGLCKEVCTTTAIAYNNKRGTSSNEWPQQQQLLLLLQQLQHRPRRTPQNGSSTRDRSIGPTRAQLSRYVWMSTYEIDAKKQRMAGRRPRWCSGSRRFLSPRAPTTTTTPQNLVPNQSDSRIAISPDHDAPLGSWTREQIRSAAAQSTMLTWNPGKAKHGLPLIRRGQGVYVYDDDDKQYLDWTSQAVCMNMGYDIPTAVLAAIQQQLQTLPFIYGGIGMCEIRARLCRLLSEILPGDLQGMVFPSSGAEANEAAITMARRFTGKTKVINWYRSYHGGTSNALQATGDFRRWYGGDHVPGFVKATHPFPLFFGLAGDTDEERTQMALNMLEEQVLNEGPHTIAMMSFESIVGSGGVLVPPNGYMQGVRALCDKYDILLHCDEVMVGFGRTGKLFGFQHFAGVLPDIITCAKGITSSAIPMSMVATRQHIMAAFEEQPLGWGSTYQG
jgi:4-aminobutyrate aminotransferase-like enzyme